MEAMTHEQGARRMPAWRIAFATGSGSLMEWFDFFIYGTAAALVFPHLFFPNLDPLLGTFFAFATFAGGFLFRPVGAAVFGHFGDRIGRKKTLILSISIMGVATIGIGALPPAASIGLLAPAMLLLLRMIQGFAVGGEFGGAVLMAVEHAPEGRRGLYGSFPQITVPLALVLSSSTYLILTQVLNPDQFITWGWRIPFLSSAVLLAIGLYIRLALAESPRFVQILQEGAVSKAPLKEVVIHHWPTMLRIALSYPAPGITFYMVSIFAVTYGVDAGLSQGSMLGITFLAALAMAVMVPVGAIASDRIGRKPVYLTGLIWIGVTAVPMFFLLDTGNVYLGAVGCLLPSFGYGACFGALGAWFSEVFPTRVRYTGISVSFNMASVLGSSTSPAVATALYLATDGGAAVGIYMILWILLSLAVTAGLPETNSGRREGVAQ